MSHKPDLSHAPVPTGLEILEQETVFQGYFRIDAYTLRHGRFDGGWTDVMRREVFERGHAVAVLPYDPDLGLFVMCEQFRVGAYAAGMTPWQIEIVAGIIEEGETPDDVALREAEEEAGRTVTELWPIQRYLATPGGASESIWLYLGRVSAKGAGGIHGVPGENEHIRVSTKTEAELRALMESGKLENAATLLAVQWFFLNRDRVLEKWKAK